MIYNYEDVKDKTLEEIEQQIKEMLNKFKRLSKQEQNDLLEALRNFDTEEEYNGKEK